MMITRKKEVSWKWAFYAQLPLILSIYGDYVISTPFLLLIKKFIDNPAAIMSLISVEVYLGTVIGPFVAWLSDRIWTRFGRRKIFVGPSDLLRGFILIAMPFAPNLWVLIILRWIYGIFGSLAAPCQALVWEMVPAKQRGRSSGMFSAFLSLGNLVFFWMLLGRFDDVYFMGPFSFLTSVSGGTIIFWIGALLFVGVALFEFLGIKEVYPSDRASLSDGRRPGSTLFVHFLREVFKDVFAKDLVPIYLFLFSSLMFGFSLGLFQPLLFTEQWGYTLQEMGNNIAVGVFFAVVVSISAGWLADKVGKMKVYIGCLIGGFIVDCSYTTYVYFQPDFRPDLWEIILWGNIGLIFAGTNGVVSYALMWEYVRRSRMGAMTAGLGIFNSIFRNGVTIFMGFWLLWWSIWFFPQGGFSVEATFSDEKDEAAVRAYLEGAGVNLEEFDLRPLHQFGVDGETSLRWWIHQNVERADDLLKERKDLENEIESLSQSRTSVFTAWFKGPDAVTEIDAKIEATRARIDEIEAQLEAGAAELRDRVEPALDGRTFPPGEQILAAELDGDEMLLSVRTIEELPEKRVEVLERKLRGPEQALEPGGGTSLFLRPRLTIEREEQPRGVTLETTLDGRFVSLFRAGSAAGLSPDESYAVGAASIATLRGLLGRSGGAFELEASNRDREEAERPSIVIEIVPSEEATPTTPQEIVDAFAQDPLFAAAEVSQSGGAYVLEVTLSDEEEHGSGETASAFIRQRLADLLGDDTAAVDLFMVQYTKLASSLASQPIYITVPNSELQTDYTEREYEYFFSSQTIQISTNVIGILIVAFIAYLERRGVVVRHGAQEDLNR